MSSLLVVVVWLLCYVPLFCDPMDCKPAKLLYPQHFPGKKTRMSCHSLLQGIFLTQESSLHLLYCRWILYCWATREAQVSSVGTWNRLLLFIPAYGFVFNYYCLDSYFGEGNGTPLQYSCLENPMDGGAWWAAVYGVAQSLTQLKQFSGSSSSRLIFRCWVSLRSKS